MASFQTILCAADFSDSSREAFRVACRMANAGQTRVILLHVEERPVFSGDMDFVLPTVDDRQSIHMDLERRLHETYPPASSLDVEYLSRDGFAAETILRVGHEVGADLIVMGTHGRTGLGRLLVGSVAEAVLRRARCPVLVARCAAKPRTGDHAVLAMSTILCATDFSGQAAAALPVARALAREHGGRLLVVHVAPFDEVGWTIPRFSNVPSRQETLDGMRQILDDSDVERPAEIHLRLGEASSEILDVADEVGPDLIVMGTHGRTGLKRALMGSVAESVLREASCPVLMIKVPVPRPDAIAPRRHQHRNGGHTAPL